LSGEPLSDTRRYHHGDLRRALIEAALALVTEEQDWGFSLREVARRAGVSHNAPYNHFVEKKDLLAAVAAAGFETLRERMLSAITGIDDPRAALPACARAYVLLGVENPALFRLMFGPALVSRPEVAKAAGAQAKAVLEDIVRRGAAIGAFAVSPTSESELAAATLAIWSAVHGLTLLVIDEVAGPQIAVNTAVDDLMRFQFQGLAPR